MIGFKQFVLILEKLLSVRRNIKPKYGIGVEDISIFINPTSSEFKNSYFEARGWITMNGDLYLFDSDSESNSNLIHRDILMMLPNVDKSVPRISGGRFESAGSPEEIGGIPVIRDGSNNGLRISESVRGSPFFNIETKSMQAVIKKFKKKNSFKLRQ